MNSSSSSLRSLVDAAASTLGGPEDTAGERRRERALKLRQARTRNANNANANAARGQVYTSAEDSDDEVEVRVNNLFVPVVESCVCVRRASLVALSPP